jgi:16S rRNA (guanine(966)-N(2))-methyltransferase RsmD
MGKRRPAEAEPSALRIIGGDLRGRKLQYHGDLRTRPMKDRVREAVFNLVDPRRRFAIDLFAGTGALGLEALSRGATQALFIERHFPTARLVETNARELGVADRVRVLPGSAFVWGKQTDAPQDVPWLVFCSPPYDFYIERADEMLGLIATLIERAPPGSTLVVEADQRFDFDSLPSAGPWDRRVYPPAVIGILQTAAALSPPAESP